MPKNPQAKQPPIQGQDNHFALLFALYHDKAPKSPAPPAPKQPAPH